MFDDDTPAITIDPPLTLEEMQSFPGGFRTVYCYPAEGGGAGSLLPREGMNYRPQWITEHLQAIVDHFPDHKFSGYVEYRNTSPSQPPVSQYWVRNRIVEPVHARIVWPVDDEVAANDSAMIQAFAVLYAREHGGYIARDGDLDDDGAGFDILWVTIPTLDGLREIGFHLDDSTGLDDIPSRRGERREVPDEDRMLEILTAARPAGGAQ